MKTTEQYFSVALFIMLYNVVQPFESVDESYCVTIQMTATDQYCHHQKVREVFKGQQAKGWLVPVLF